MFNGLLFSFSLGRHTLQFSPDKIDTMIVQAISVLDDADKEINNYCMRSRELYGWHFPELGRIIEDNLKYVETVKRIGKLFDERNYAICFEV